jgi:hypothetical protein
MRLCALLSFLLFCQICVSAQPGTSKAAKGKSKPVMRHLDIQLKDVGLTPKVLGNWNRPGQRGGLTFLTVTFERKIRGDQRNTQGATEIQASSYVADGMEVPVFELQAKPALPEERADRVRPEGFLRLTKRGAEMSVDGGAHWVLAEKQAERTIFAFDNLTVSVVPMDEVFQPTRYQALAFEHGVVTQSTKDNVFPYFHSVVMVLAYGRNELEGILKYPGTDFVVPFRGIQHGNLWVARSLSEAPFNVTVWRNNPGPRGALSLQGGLFTQIEMDGRRMLLGTGSFVNYGVNGETSERLGTAVEWTLTQGKELPTLAEGFKANYGRSLWTKTDEKDSFSRDAEKEYFAMGLKVWLWAPLTEPESSGYSGYSHKAHQTFDPIAQRINKSGGSLSLLDVIGQTR